jgi:hypothetical protein
VIVVVPVEEPAVASPCDPRIFPMVATVVLDDVQRTDVVMSTLGQVVDVDQDEGVDAV